MIRRWTMTAGRVPVLPLLSIAISLVAAGAGGCGRDASVPPSHPAGTGAAYVTAAGVTAPRSAGDVFAPMDGGVAVRLPPGLSYCPMPPGAEGIWREETFYLVPPSGCGADKFPLPAGGSPLPAITVAAKDNLTASVERGGEGEARTAAELLRHDCAHPAPLPGVRMFGRAATGCRVERNGVITVTAAALYYDQRTVAPRVVPDGVLTVTLTSTRARLLSDWGVLLAVAGSAYQCVYPGLPGPPGRPACPPTGPW
jgi:hypothetical protein